MKTIAFILLITLSGFQILGQSLITGSVKDLSGEYIPGANVYIKNTYDGTSSDIDGDFRFMTSAKGGQILVVSFLGYKTHETPVHCNGEEVTMHIELQPDYNEIDGVVITAGSFEASDEKKAVILKPLDIVTTAGSNGDITGALNSLPGTMKVGEDGKLFVRGGDSYETTTFVDGMPVEHAYSSTMPDVPSRNRFSPYLFSGTVFSTGGYSAEFGQALSSALILNSNDLPDNSSSSISLMSIGLGGSHTHRWDHSSLSASLEYFNLSPYYAMVPQNMEWLKAPNGFAGNVIFRQKSGENGLLKGFANFSNSYSEMKYPDPKQINNTMNLSLRNNNLYLQGNYRDIISEKWISNSGISYEFNDDKTGINSDLVNESDRSIRGKHTMTYILNDQVKFKGGADFSVRDFEQEFDDSLENKTYVTEVNDRLYAGFLETEMSISKNFAARIGGRVEYSGLLKKTTIAPRVSFAYKTGEHSQVSMAYGTFYQTPHDDYLRFTHSLNFEKASHYIVNYQVMKNRRIFRIEGYYKTYDNLVKYNNLHNPDPSSYNNNGNGYARGIDVFFRDQKTFSNGDYWISYSYLDTERNYKDYPVSAIPTFVSNHNLSFVFKYWIEKISSQVGGTYSLSSGRTYYNPNSAAFLGDKTKANHDLSLNISYLTDIFNKFTIIHLSVTNVLGLDQVYGYRYQNIPGETGEYPSIAVKPAAKRFIFLGAFISL